MQYFFSKTKGFLLEASQTTCVKFISLSVNKLLRYNNSEMADGDQKKYEEKKYVPLTYESSQITFK